MTNAMPSIQSVNFRGDGIVEITYVEQSEQTPEMALVRMLMFSEDSGGPLLIEVMDSLMDLLDDRLRALRNPPETRPSRRNDLAG